MALKQKFNKLAFVKVDKEMPVYKKHFDSDFIGIVAGTYSQIYGGGGRHLKEYSLYKIDNGKVVDRISWYNEDQLTLLPEQDRYKAEEMIEQYNMKRFG